MSGRSSDSICPSIWIHFQAQLKRIYSKTNAINLKLTPFWAFNKFNLIVHSLKSMHDCVKQSMMWIVKLWNEKCEYMREIFNISRSWQELDEFISEYSDILATYGAATAFVFNLDSLPTETDLVKQMHSILMMTPTRAFKKIQFDCFLSEKCMQCQTTYEMKCENVK